MRTLIDRDAEHRALYQVFLEVRDAAARILENTTIADIIKPPSPPSKDLKKSRKKILKSSLAQVATRQNA